MKSKPKEKNNHPTQPHWREMNRKQGRETMRKIQSEDLSLELVHRDAAGIDIVNESHYVAVPPSRDNQPVRRFGCTTAELNAMADWLTTRLPALHRWWFEYILTRVVVQETFWGKATVVP